MSTPASTTAITQARDLLRWRSPLRTELWASRLMAGQAPAEARRFVQELVEADRPEARLALAALAVTATTEPDASATEPDAAVAPDLYTAHGAEARDASPAWVRRMGQVDCDGAWYGKADRHGQQTLAVLSFRYRDGKEPHMLIVAIDQVNGGLAVDALVEEPKFLDDLSLEASEPRVVAGRILDALELTDRVMGAAVADTYPAVRPFALARALTVPDPVRPAPDDTLSRFHDLPATKGADEAFAKLAEFIGDRPLWWSPGRVSQFLTSWLPREAILSPDAISAMPDVVRAWSRFAGADPDVLRQVDSDAPRLAALMADESLAGFGKRLTRSRLHPRAED
ncbi:hypothetical protein HTZ77_32350 [Nonomuraea sp. SMC257]|uniref:Uncharacterized protein n=1 Tax=Nonomuraea montanisoli TaxID=2741721 RepID=A0A7Y6ID47_9ACTN|nr:hypothetical protein [Nonomuraea montanisoli]NUW36073.1 hypothetical protein [Nonomuraea montanisoli]